MFQKTVLFLLCLSVIFVMSPCTVFAEKITQAVAVISPTASSNVHGVVQFSAVPEGIKVHATFSGLAPGKHGFHIHEFGDISASNGSGVGGHFNPLKKEHNSPDATDRHCGDMGNVVADKEGFATLDYVDKSLSLNGENSIIGRGVIVHEKEDDFKTQPTGGAGNRIGQGTVGIAKAK